MHIPTGIKKALRKSPFENMYFRMHENMRTSLDKVLNKEDTYASYHYSMLINDYEMVLK